METKSINQQSVFITGANGGLGLETSKLLAKSGFARITLAARTQAKAEGAKAAVLAKSSFSGNLEAFGGFDMNQPEAIERAVEALPANQSFDTLFFQVGGVFLTNDYQYVHIQGKKVEKTIFQNIIGAYITLVNLQKHNLVATDARIVFAGGEGVRGIPGMIEKPVFETAESFRAYLFGEGKLPAYNALNAIGVSKLASAWLTQQLAALNDGRTYLWFSPGLTHGTNGLAAMPAIKRFFMEKIAFGIAGLLGFSQSPKQGAQKYLDSLIGKMGQNGDVLGAPDRKTIGRISDQKPMNASITDPALIEGFGQILAELYAPYPTFSLSLTE